VKHNVSVSVSNSLHGNASGNANISHGYQHTVVATPYSCYNFLNWSNIHGVVVSTQSSFTFTVECDTALVANFILKTFSITLAANPGGTVEGGGLNLGCGTEVEIWAKPDPFFEFVNWTENGINVPGLIKARDTITVTSDRHLVANFKVETFNIFVRAEPLDGGIVQGGGTDIDYLTPMTVEAFPSSLYDFSHWEFNGTVVSYSLEYTFPVVASGWMVAHFLPKTYQVTVSAQPPWGGTACCNRYNIAYGDTITVFAHPNLTYEFDYWSEDGVKIEHATDTIYHFPVTRSRHLVAHFRAKTYQITVSVEPPQGGQAIIEGVPPFNFLDEIAVLAIPNHCYIFSHWSEGDNPDPVCVDARFPFPVTGDRHLIAHFIPQLFDITLEPFEVWGGTVWGGGYNIPCDSMITVHAAPALNHVFLYWKEDDLIVSEDADYEFNVLRSRHLVAHFALECFDVVLLANPHFGGTVIGGGSCIPYGTTLSIKAIANLPYFSFVKWTKDGNFYTGDSTFLYAVAQTCTLVAHFTAEPFTITVSASPAEGGMAIGGGTFDFGTEITVIASPEKCYDFVHWTIDGVVVSTQPVYTFPVEGHADLVANFVQQTYDVILSGASGGSTSGSLLDVPCGETVTVFAYPDPEYEFVKWTENGDSISNSAAYSFTVAQSHHLVAHFTLKIINIIVKANPISGGLAWGGGMHLPYDTLITVYADPFDDYEFLNWTVNGLEVSTADIFSFNAVEAMVLYANFVPKKYSITLEEFPPYSGYVWDSGLVSFDSDITVHALATDNYTFDRWEEDNVPVSYNADYLFTVTRPRHLVAHFRANTFLITVDVMPPDGGTAIGGGIFPFETEITVVATANPTHIFSHWTDASGVFIPDSAYTFLVTESRDLIAHFILKPFNITVEASGGGSAWGEGFNIPYNTMHTVHAQAATNNVFVNWTEEGIHASFAPDYEFVVTRSRHLVANFTPQPYDIFVQASPPAGGIVTGSTTDIPYGTIHTVTAAPASGFFQFTHWTWSNGTHASGDPTFSFPVTSSDTLTAHFDSEIFNINLSASPVGSGTVIGGGLHPYGFEITVSATPFHCHVFVNWTEDGAVVCLTPDYTFIVEGHRNLVANFALATFNLTLISNPGGGGTFESSLPPTGIPCDSEITILAKPNLGYIFVDWREGDGTFISNTEQISFTVTASRTLIANYIYVTHQLILYHAPTIAGTTSGSGTYPHNTDTIIRALPNQFYEFSHWEEADTIVAGMGQHHPLTVTASRTLTAHFTEKFYTITTDPFPLMGGTTTGDDTDIPYGESRTVEAFADDNYDFKHWEEGGAIVYYGSEYTFPVLRDHALVAVFEGKKFMINVSWTPSDGGTASGGGLLSYNDIDTVKAFALMNYDFEEWRENDTVVCRDAEYDFVVARSRHLVAHFTPKGYNITTEAHPPGSGTTSGGGINLSYGMDTAVMAQPAPNFKFVNWTEDGIQQYGDPVYPFPVTRSRHLVAHFTLQTFDVLVAANPPHAAVVSGGGLNLPYGQSTTVRANGNDHYTFINWTIDGIPKSVEYPEFTFPVTQSCTIIANYTSERYHIGLRPDPPLGGTVSGGGLHHYGDSVTVYAAPNLGYIFERWTDGDDVVSMDLEYGFRVTGHRDLVAHFVLANFDVTVSSNPSVGGAASGGGSNIPAQTTLTVSAEAFEEYRFINWMKNGVEVSTDTDYTFKVVETCHLAANFSLHTYAIDLLALPPQSGTVHGAGDYPHGDFITVSAVPKAGNMFVKWTEGDVVVSEAADYSFTVTQSRMLVAHFDVQRYTVTVEVNDTIFGHAYESGVYEANEMVHVWAVPNNGFKFSHWTISGNFITNTTTYEFMVTEDLTLVAHFYALDFDTYAATLWNNTFMLNLNLLEHEGYVIAECKWLKNNKIETLTHSYDQFSYSAGPKSTDLLEPNPTFYMFRLTLENGVLLYSTRKVIPPYQIYGASAEHNLLIYPNPSFSGATFTVENLNEGSMIYVYNQFGVCVSQSVAQSEKATLSLNLPAGIYLIRSDEKTGKVVILK
jgi:hypothetical protein